MSIRHDAQKALEKFVLLLSTQTKLVKAEDMIPKISYTYTNSTNGINISRCILWEGIRVAGLILSGLNLDEKKYDAQLNIEIVPHGIQRTFVFIFFHKKGERFDNFESWEEEVK